MMNEWLRTFGLPEVASAHGQALDDMLGYVHWLMLVLFVGWGAFYLYTLYRFRAGNNPKADYEGVKNHSSSYLEAGVAIVETIILIGFAIPLWAERVNEFPAEQDAVVVRVVAEQFAWNIHYPGPDGVFGNTSVDLIDTESNPLGLDKNDPKCSR